MGLEPVTNTAPHADPTDEGRPGTPMDQHDRYLLPDPSGDRDGLVPFTRASTVKKRIQNSESLKVWNEIMLAKGFGIAPDLVALAASTPLGAPGSRAILVDAVEQAKVRAGGRASANLGSALHAFTEQIDRGEALADVLERVPDALKADVQAYVDMLDRYGLTPVPELVERIVVNTQLQTGLQWDGTPGTRKDAAAGVAARFDRMYRWTDPEGRAWLIPGDLKTGKNAVKYGALETCVQEAIAARADLLWNEESETYEDMPGSPGYDDGGQLRTDIGLLIHLPVGTGTCEPEELDLELGWELAQLAVRLMIVDKAKDHCHRPFGAQVFPQRFVQAPEDAEPQQITYVDVTDGTLKTAPADQVKIAGTVPVQVPTGPDSSVEREVPTTAEAFNQDKAADGTSLQPLARDVPGRRGCSVCGRVGHRKGSAACWGDQDPSKAQERALEPGRDGAELEGRTTAEEPAALSCPHAGGFTRQHVFTEPGGQQLPAEHDIWVCADCGQETERAADARRAREAMDSPGPTAAEISEVLASSDAPEDVVADAMRAAEELEGPPKDPEQYDAPAEDEAALDALLADPQESPEEAVHRFIREAQSRADLQNIRRGALEAGTWTKEHTQAGLARLRELTS